MREVGPAVADPVYGSVRPVTLKRYDLLGALVELRYGRTDAANANNPAADLTTVQATYTFDDFGRLLRETDAGGRTWRHAYDRYGNRIRTTDPKGQVTTWTYSYGGRLPIERLDASGRKTTYAWDPLGALTRVASLDAGGNPVIAYDYGYDEAARLVRVTDSRASQWLGWQWSPGGQLNRLTDSDGRSTAWQYGPSGRLTSLWAPDGEQLSFAYDAGGRLLERRFGNGAGSRFAWNADGTLAQRQNFASATTLVSQHDYTYDALGRRTRHLEQIAGTATDYRYAYDGLGRLTEARNGSNNALLEGYSYDLLGNRLTRTTASGTDAYVHDAAAAQLLEVRANTAGGPLTRALVYDANGNLTRQCSGSGVTRTGSTCTGSDVATYGYDALDRLAQASLTGSQTLTEAYAYDPQGRRLQKTSNGTLSQYRYAGDALYADYGPSLASPRTLYLQGAGTDEPLLAIDPASPANRRYYHADGLGSLVAVTDPAGALAASRRYDSFGRVLASSGPLPTYGYSGREPDASGLMYYRARYYAPELGRFTQPDPIGLSGGINRYAYVGGSPVNFRDPSGLRAAAPVSAGATPHAYPGDLNGGVGVLGSVAVAAPSISVGLQGSGFLTGLASGVETTLAYLGRGVAALGGGVGSVIVGALIPGNLTTDRCQGGEVLGCGFIPEGPGAVGTPGLRPGTSAGDGVYLNNSSEETAKDTKYDVDAMAQAAAAPDRGGLTRAGRALDKHGAGQRSAGSPFPAPRGGPTEKNAAGQFQVEDILTHPDAVFSPLGRGGIGVRTPDGREIRFDANGRFAGFIE